MLAQAPNNVFYFDGTISSTLALIELARSGPVKAFYTKTKEKAAIEPALNFIINEINANPFLSHVDFTVVDQALTNPTINPHSWIGNIVLGFVNGVLKARSADTSGEVSVRDNEAITVTKRYVINKRDDIDAMIAQGGVWESYSAEVGVPTLLRLTSTLAEDVKMELRTLGYYSTEISAVADTISNDFGQAGNIVHDLLDRRLFATLALEHRDALQEALDKRLSAVARKQARMVTTKIKLGRNADFDGDELNGAVMKSTKPKAKAIVKKAVAKKK